MNQGLNSTTGMDFGNEAKAYVFALSGNLCKQTNLLIAAHALIIAMTLEEAAECSGGMVAVHSEHGGD
jgi:hypothetical protein